MVPTCPVTFNLFLAYGLYAGCGDVHHRFESPLSENYVIV